MIVKPFLVSSVIQVVQIYMSWTNASVPVPKLQLCGFQRQLLKVKDTAAFSFVVTPEQMAVWISNAEGFRVELGTLLVGLRLPEQLGYVRAAVRFITCRSTLTGTARVC